MKDSLGRFRVMAYVVGVMLLVLVCVAMPLKYIADDTRVLEIVGPIHGFLYIVYLLAALDLAVKRHWRPSYTILVLLSGAVPFLSFVMERRVAAQQEPERESVRL